ncbi:unnamed protein product [Nyctereutes procyonoides]|uniref:Guanine nucleotide-binding protein subunit gamma n=1 Tax=Nyctereutes procyonoides TaxID=34880 RepID=A0A811ZNQ9_NYCPR|nr:unnamed protein product [Nyctereutes procyonoides]
MLLFTNYKYFATYSPVPQPSHHQRGQSAFRAPQEGSENCHYLMHQELHGSFTSSSPMTLTSTPLLQGTWIKVSQAAAELQQYCVQNARKDALLVGVPAGSNPLREPRSCALF